MGFMVAIGFWVRRQNAGKNFVQSYFIGNHDLGGFVLAMTTVATYSSVSSFVGGPGMAWQIGFGWVYMAVVQVTAIFNCSIKNSRAKNKKKYDNVQINCKR